MRAGQMLANRYRLERPLGRGGMGEVWEGFDQRLRRRVAIKLLLADHVADERLSAQLLARFYREAEAAARLNHRNIAIIHDLGEHREDRGNGIERTHPFLVLEFLDGRDLKTVLQAHPGGLPVQEVLDYGVQVCDGLTAAHAAGVVHRDIKPANLMVLDDGTVKICDFGIARLQDGTAGLTRDGFQPGTPAYMAPEQLDDQQVDYRTDLYALGATLYHLLTGQTVFPTNDLRALIAMHLAKTPAPPSTHRPAIPSHVDNAIVTLLAKAPAQRFTSASEAADSLKAAPIIRSPHLAEAARIALSITHPHRQALVLPEVVGAVAVHDPVEAVRIARSATDPASRMWALRGAAEAVAARDPAQAERIARSLPNPDEQARALSDVAKVAAGHDPVGAQALLAEAERIAHSLTDPDREALVLMEVAGAVDVHDPTRAQALLAQAERIARSITDPDEQARRLSMIARAVAAHDLARAERIARSITDPDEQARALRAIAEAAAVHDLAEAERIARSITDSFQQMYALEAVAEAVAVRDLAQAERIARSITSSSRQTWALRAVAEAVAVQDLAQAERIARSITFSFLQGRALMDVAKAVAVRDLAAAERIARSLTDPDEHARALVGVAGAVAVHDPTRAQALLAQAERIARSIADADGQEHALSDVAKAVVGG